MSCGLPKPARALTACLLVLAELPVPVVASQEGDCRAAALRGYWRKKLGLHPLSTPKPTGPQQYCPDPAVDFQEEVEGPAGKVDWLESGWSIQGQRRVSSKASFDLRGGWVEFDMDLSNAHGGVNTNLYLTFPHQPNCGLKCYCDSGPTGGCAELDFIENNGNCFAQTTWHPEPSGSNKAGFGGGSNIGPQVHVRAEFTADGATLDVNVNGNHHSGPGLGGEMDAHGAVIYSSEWVGWVPGNCPGDGNLGLANFKVQNLKVLGKVKQGPQPRLCSQRADMIYK
mmetsp:Transcript_50092/g.139139  ORF Transcript_50092/g.139139 Transcript_50092/m.139139 type:complete len:283 (-) Transcript_50092:140-988(-)